MDAIDRNHITFRNTLLLKKYLHKYDLKKHGIVLKFLIKKYRYFKFARASLILPNPFCKSFLLAA